MRARLSGVTKSHGAQVVLENASLEVGPRARIGLVGPNGVGKSTVLRLLAGEEASDAGAVAMDPPRATVAHLPQGRSCRGETLRGRLARLTGVAAAEQELEAAAAALARESETARVESTQALSDRYDLALARFLALGGGDLDARAAATCARLGLGVDLDRAFDGLSGGEAARASLAALLLARPTCSCSTSRRTTRRRRAGSARDVRRRLPGAIVVVSHDRAFLVRTVRHRRDRPALACHRQWGAAGRTTLTGATRRAGCCPLRRCPRASPRAHDAARTGRFGRSEGAGLRSAPAAPTVRDERAPHEDRRPRSCSTKPAPGAVRAVGARPRSLSGRLPSPVVRLSGVVVERAFRLGHSTRAPARRATRRVRPNGTAVDARPRSARRARARSRHARDRAWRRRRRDRPGAGHYTSGSRCSRRSRVGWGSTRSTRARCSRSSGSARHTSSGSVRRLAVSAPARISRSSVA